MAVPSKYIQSVQKAAKGRPKSTDWYREKIREFGTPKALDLIRDFISFKISSILNSI